MARKFGAEVDALLREMGKDLRGTLHQIFYGQPEHPSEPGTPLNPTPQIVTEGLTGRGVNAETDRVQEGGKLTLAQMRGMQSQERAREMNRELER